MLKTATPHIDAAKDFITTYRKKFENELAAAGEKGGYLRISLAMQEAALIAIALEMESGADKRAMLSALAYSCADVLSAGIKSHFIEEGWKFVSKDAIGLLYVVVDVITQKAALSLECGITSENAREYEFTIDNPTKQ